MSSSASDDVRLEHKHTPHVIGNFTLKLLQKLANSSHRRQFYILTEQHRWKFRDGKILFFKNIISVWGIYD